MMPLQPFEVTQLINCAPGGSTRVTCVRNFAHFIAMVTQNVLECHAGKIISKIAHDHEPAKARVRVAARALRLRVQPQRKAMHASPRSRKKMSPGVQRAITALWKQWRPLKRRTFPCFCGWIAAPARARGPRATPKTFEDQLNCPWFPKKEQTSALNILTRRTWQVQRENKERAGDEDALPGLSAKFFHYILSLLCLSSSSILLKCLPGGSERRLDAQQGARHPINQSKRRPHAKRINSANPSPIVSRMVSNWR